MAVAPLADRLRAEIRQRGPLPVSRFVEAALYDEHDGFYATGGHAGRRGDFITSPEVGPLFGAVISRAVDLWWIEAGRPDGFTVVEHGAGPGTLGRSITAAAGECLSAGALRWVMVERSPAQRANHPTGSHLASLAPSEGAEPAADVVLANELLDNLPFDIVARRGDAWIERRVTVDGGRFTLVDGPSTIGVALGPLGEAELPVAAAAAEWVRDQRDRNPAARLIVIDYMAKTEELVRRDGGWLRAYRGHEAVDDWLDAPGTADITIDVPLDQLPELEGAIVRAQADFLRAFGIDALVEEGRALWQAGAAVGDLAALMARSRVREAEALLDPAGLGAFTVIEWPPAALSRY